MAFFAEGEALEQAPAEAPETFDDLEPPDERAESWARRALAVLSLAGR